MKNKNALLALLLVLALMLCLLPATALAAGGDGDEADQALPAEAPEEVSVEEGEEYKASAATLVYNNGGTVFANGGVVYNNGGTVYSNGGTIYNNAGVVYANGGTVYNNAGTVYNNAAVIYTFEGDVEDSVIYGTYRLTTTEDYSALARIEGLTMNGEAMLVSKDAQVLIAPKPGFIITKAAASSGRLTANEDGSYTLTDVDSKLELTLRFQVETPVLSLVSGTYAEAKTVEISAPEGARILYTLDGSEPTADSALVYEGPVEIREGAVLKAVSAAEGAENSPVVSAEYALLTVTAPVFEDVAVGYSRPEARGIQVVNTGAVSAKVESVSLEGKDAEHFTLNRTGGARVSAGKTDESTWTIRPDAKLDKGSYTAVVVFTLDSGETLSANVAFIVK